ncbi:hypothetical protein CRUP_010162 [Coryphaenoides rupestris]|nr:hypothetical protein CRUP_010162 [Coryphaenoides rupestris]
MPMIGSFNVHLRPPESLFKVIFWLGYFNSCLNPIIYPCYSREFKMAFIRILRCQCHRRRKRPGWRAYDYRSSNMGSSSINSRKSSAEHNSLGLDGSQRTLPSSPSPSPGYLAQPRDSLYAWGGGGGGGGGASPTTTTTTTAVPNLLPGILASSSTSTRQVRGPGEAAGGGGPSEDTSRGVFFFFGQNGGREAADGRGLGVGVGVGVGIAPEVTG